MSVECAIKLLKSLMGAVEATMREFRGNPDTYKMGLERVEALRMAIGRLENEKTDGEDS